MSIALDRFKNFKNTKYASTQEHMKTLENGQSPEVLFITCADSRLMPTDITDSKAGELFVIRNAGNLVPKFESGISTSESLTIEYAVSVLGVKEIVVCGHVSCGAMDGILKLDQLTSLECVHSHLDTCSKHFDQTKLAELRNSDDPKSSLSTLIEDNVSLQVRHLLSYPFIANKVKSGELNIYGWVYDFVNGEIVSNVAHTELV